MGNVMAALSLVLVFLGLTGCTASRHEAVAPRIRIGTYDSRAVAIAYCGSDWHEAKIAERARAYEQAKAVGDKKTVRQIESEMEAHQKRLHRQGFGTAPVDDILAVIADKMPGIAERANVAVIGSQWDKRFLKANKSADLVDVTEQVVAEFDSS